MQELAHRALVSASYIYAIEAGVRGSHIDKLYRICKQLGLKLDDLCYRAFDDGRPHGNGLGTKR